MSISVNNNTTINYTKANDKKVSDKKPQEQVSVKDNSSGNLNVKSNVSKLPAQGKSTASLSIFESKVSDKPIINLPNTKAGAKYEVDGPLWFDGKAELKKYDASSLEFKINMKAADKILGQETNLPYKIKDGKVSLTVKLEKLSNNEFKMITIDHNNSDKKLTQNVKSSGSESNVTMSDKYGNKTTFNVKKNGDMTIKVAGVPFGFDLNKI